MTTQIGPNTFINGHLEGHGEIVVEGRVEGSIVLDDTLMVLDGGFVAGDVEVDVIVVEGAFSGTIRATRLVHLRASAQVSAQIFSQNVRIDPGAHFKGRIEMDVNAAPAQATRQPVTAVAPTQVVETRTYSTAPMRSTAAPVRATAASARTTTERPRYEQRPQTTNGSYAATNGDTRSTARYTEPPRNTRPPVRTEPVRNELVRSEPVRNEPVQAEPQRVETVAPPAERQPEPVVSRAPKPSPPASAAPKNGSNGVAIGDPDEMTVKELRDMLKEHDLPVSGTKQELVERLRELGDRRPRRTPRFPLRFSFRTGDFVLASGEKSSYYIDVRKTALTARGSSLIGQLLFEEAQLVANEARGVGGMTLGADPIITAITVAADHCGRDFGGVIVRKEAKQHGMADRLVIAGNVPAGAELIAVDDVVTTAGSTLQAIAALRSGGFVVRHALAVVDREGGGADNLAGAGVELRSLFRVSDLVDAAAL